MIYPSFDQKFRVASPEGDCFNEKIEFEEKKCFRYFAKIVARQQHRPNLEKTSFLRTRFLHWNNRPPGTQREISDRMIGISCFFDNFLTFCPIFRNRTNYQKNIEKYDIPIISIQNFELSPRRAIISMKKSNSKKKTFFEISSAGRFC